MLHEFSRCHSRVSFPILLKAIDYSLLLEEVSSVISLEAPCRDEVVGRQISPELDFHIMRTSAVSSNRTGFAPAFLWIVVRELPQLLAPGFGFRQPAAAELFGGDAGHVGFDVEDRSAVEHVDSANVELSAIAMQQFNHG